MFLLIGVIFLRSSFLMCISLFSTLEALVAGHTVSSYLPRHGLPGILVPVLLSVELCAFTVCHISL